MHLVADASHGGILRRAISGEIGRITEQIMSEGSLGWSQMVELGVGEMKPITKVYAAK